MKVQAHSSVEPPLEYNQDQPPLMSKAFLTTSGVTEILYSFKIGLEGEACKEMPESTRLEFLEDAKRQHLRAVE